MKATKIRKRIDDALAAHPSQRLATYDRAQCDDAKDCNCILGVALGIRYPDHTEAAPVGLSKGEAAELILGFEGDVGNSALALTGRSYRKHERFVG